ncbi:transporter substrate-binding domain-containing protein, partial [Acinetobacter baumannii]|nr:transporter substrate-binding domain-containing protein [Acinetobacter baumannii]
MLKKIIKNIIKNIIVVSLFGVIAMGLGGCGNVENSKITTIDKDELIIGLDDTFVPLGFKDENGKTAGFDVDLAKAVGEKLGKEIGFQ